MLLEIFTRIDELTKLAKQWADTEKAIQVRLPAWLQLLGLVVHAKDLGPYLGMMAEIKAVSDQRGLLADPDPVRPLLGRTTELLRQALNAKLSAYSEEYTAQMSSLQADSNWQQLSTAQQAKLITDHSIEAPKAISLATADTLADALDECNLNRWIERTQALSTRFGAVRLDAAKLLKPNVVQVHLPKRTLNNEEEVRVWLEEVQAMLLEKVQKGPLSL